MDNQRTSEIAITYMSGPLDGKTVSFAQPSLGVERVLTIGRREGCDIHMPYDNQVSRLHARLLCTYRPPTESTTASLPGILTFWLEDATSRNGTFVERHPEPIKGRVSLRPGTLFRIGRTWLRLEVPASY